MSEHQKLLDYIATTTNQDHLKNLIQNARKRGNNEVADAAFRRLIALRAVSEPGTIQHAFWSMVAAFELVLTEERGRTTRLGYTRRKVAKDGEIATLSGWALGKPTPGFRMLAERRMLDLSGEAIVLRFADKFSAAAVAAAKERLRAYGYQPAR